MIELKQKLIVDHLQEKLNFYKPLQYLERPEKGWINAIRIALGMSYRQLSDRLGFSNRSSAKSIERREQDSSITLKALEEVAHALDMKMVYGFVPKNGSIKEMIEKRAYELAKEIVSETSHNMALENQKNKQERLEKAIEDRAQQIMYKMPRYLWD